MASIYDLKPGFQSLLRPLTTALASKGVTANQVTLLAAGLSVTLGLLLYLGKNHPKLFLLVPPFLLLRMGLNAIDGMLAREYDMKTRLGAVLNELGDVVSDSFLYMPLALIPGINSAVTVIVVMLAVISEMAGVIAIQIGSDRRYDGPMGKSDRAFAFGVLYLLLGLGFSVGTWTNLFLFIMLALLVLTIKNRVQGALRQEGT